MRKDRGLQILAELLERIPLVRDAGSESVLYFRWLKDVEAALANLFDPIEGRRHVATFRDIHAKLSPPHVALLELGIEWKTFAKAMELSDAYLRSVVHEISEYYDDDEDDDESVRIGDRLPNPQSKDVFVVHGRNDALKEGVARFLSTLGLNPIILHEKPNAGQTLIEKFETHARTSYAIALFTRDDVGRLNVDGETDRPRARQNVIFELGFFIGRLGRHRACALVEAGVELPSDYGGVVFIPTDAAGHWKFALIRELRAAGYDVDANRAL